MKTVSKALVGTVAAGAMAMTSATPALARDHDDGIDAGDVIAGAVIIGGIAALAGAFDRDDRRYRDRRGHRYGARGAVERCVRAVERDARRSGYRMANVTEIRDVDGRRGNLRVRGRLVVDGRYDRYGRYGYGRYDRRGYGRYDRNRGYDRGKFTCRISRGRVYDIDYSGIRGLR